MDNIKIPLRRSGRTLGLVLFFHQLFFQTLSGALALLSIFAFLSFDASLYLFSDIAMLVSAVIFLVFYLVNRAHIREHTPRKGSMTLACFLKCVIIILGVNCLLSGLDTFFNLATGLSLTFPTESAEVNPILLLLTVGVFPAVMEELVFRGIIYRYLKRHGAVFAAFASSLLFGLIHLNILQALFAFCMGLVLCFAYEKTGKLIYSMLLHFINNSLMVLLTVLPVEAQVMKIAESAAGLVFLTAGVIYLIKKKWAFAVDDARFGQKCRFFFTSVPMALLVIICSAVCIAVIFI